MRSWFIVKHQGGDINSICHPVCLLGKKETSSAVGKIKTKGYKLGWNPCVQAACLENVTLLLLNPVVCPETLETPDSTLKLTQVPRATLLGVSRAAKTGSLVPHACWSLPGMEKIRILLALGAWWALVAASGTSLHHVMSAPAPHDFSKRCVRTLRASGTGPKEAPACCLPGKCPQGQGCSAPLLKAFLRDVMPRREEEFGRQNPQSACKPPGIRTARAVRRQPEAPHSLVTASEWGFGMRHTLPPCSPSQPPPPSESEIPGCRVWQFQSRGGGGSSAQGSLQPGCWGTLMGCGRCGFGPLRLRRERNPGLPLPQHILWIPRHYIIKAITTFSSSCFVFKRLICVESFEIKGVGTNLQEKIPDNGSQADRIASLQPQGAFSARENCRYTLVLHFSCCFNVSSCLLPSRRTHCILPAPLCSSLEAPKF